MAGLRGGISHRRTVCSSQPRRLLLPHRGSLQGAEAMRVVSRWGRATGPFLKPGTFTVCVHLLSTATAELSALSSEAEAYANTHRSTFPHCKMRIVKLQPNTEASDCSFVVTHLPTCISWSLTVCLASPGPAGIPGSKLSSSDLA